MQEPPTPDVPRVPMEELVTPEPAATPLWLRAASEALHANASVADAASPELTLQEMKTLLVLQQSQLDKLAHFVHSEQQKMQQERQQMQQERQQMRQERQEMQQERQQMRQERQEMRQEWQQMQRECLGRQLAQSPGSAGEPAAGDSQASHKTCDHTGAAQQAQGTSQPASSAPPAAAAPAVAAPAVAAPEAAQHAARRAVYIARQRYNKLYASEEKKLWEKRTYNEHGTPNWFKPNPSDNSNFPTLVSARMEVERLEKEEAHQREAHEAEAKQRKLLEARLEVLGTRNPDTLAVMGDLALMLWEHGKHAEAKELGEEVGFYRTGLGPPY